MGDQWLQHSSNVPSPSEVMNFFQDVFGDYPYTHDNIRSQEAVHESYDQRTFNGRFENFGGSSQYVNDFYPRIEHLQINTPYIRDDVDDENDKKD
ncbi:hypothetical protein SDJN03_02562, partial [Cucurbita argyrosperma subsp. sororia]